MSFCIIPVFLAFILNRCSVRFFATCRCVLGFTPFSASILFGLALVAILIKHPELYPRWLRRVNGKIICIYELFASIIFIEIGFCLWNSIETFLFYKIPAYIEEHCITLAFFYVHLAESQVAVSIISNLLALAVLLLTLHITRVCDLSLLFTSDGLQRFFADLGLCNYRCDYRMEPPPSPPPPPPPPPHRRAEFSRESIRESIRESHRDSVPETYRETFRETHRDSIPDNYRDPHRDSTKLSFRETQRDRMSESQRDNRGDSFSSSHRDSFNSSQRDSLKSSRRGSYSSSHRDSLRDIQRESYRDSYRDIRRESSRDEGPEESFASNISITTTKPKPCGSRGGKVLRSGKKIC